MNITGRLKTPIKTRGSKYCYNVQSDIQTLSCCNPSYLNTIQLFQDAVTNRILDLNGKRDIWLKHNIQFIKQVNEAFSNITKLMLKATNNTLNEIIRVRMAPFRTWFNALRDDFEDLLNTFGEFQQKRATCLRRMVMVQGGLYCLACDANYAQRGVDRFGNVTFNPNLCVRIQVDCHPYLIAAMKQNRIASQRRALTVLQGLANITADFNGFPRPFNTDPNGNKINYLPEVQRNGNPPVSYIGWRMARDGAPVVVMDFARTEIQQMEVTPPPGCDDETNATKCTFICSLRAFVNYTLSPQVFGLGGVIVPNDATIVDATLVRLRQLEEGQEDNYPEEMMIEDDGTRELQQFSGTFDCDDGQTGTLPNVIADPAGVGFSPIGAAISWISILVIGIFYLL